MLPNTYASGVVNLWIGEENYAERLQNFVANYAEIHQKRPDVNAFDLRVDGVITAVREEAQRREHLAAKTETCRRR